MYKCSLTILCVSYPFYESNAHFDGEMLMVGSEIMGDNSDLGKIVQLPYIYIYIYTKSQYILYITYINYK